MEQDDCFTAKPTSPPQPQPTLVHLGTLALPLFVLTLIFCLISPLIAWLLSVKMYIFPLLKKNKAQQLMSGREKVTPLPLWVQGQVELCPCHFFPLSLLKQK